MAGEGSKSATGGGGPASRAEIDALSEIIAATIAVAVRARSEAATTLLERALATLNDRSADGSPEEDQARFGSFRAS